MSIFCIKFDSQYLHDRIDVTVVTPNPAGETDCTRFYDADTTFPVLWMLHGGYGSFADWVTYNTVPRSAMERGVILVAPYAPNSDFNNHPEIGDGYYFSDFFLQELVPFVRNWFHGSSESGKNLISGNSMGCAAAWRYGLSRPDLFGYVGPLCNQPLDYSYLEPYRSLSTAQFCRIAAAEQVPTAYGIDSATIHDKELANICRYDTVGDFLDSIENTWARFDEAADQGTLPRIFISGSDEKKWGGQMRKFRDHVRERNIQEVTFDMYDMPTHNSPFWEQSVERFMNYAGLTPQA